MLKKFLATCAVLTVLTVFVHPIFAVDCFEKSHHEIALTATTNAPAGASGKIDFDADFDEGTNAVSLEIETQGLLPGNYTVSVTDISGTNIFVLGTLNVSAFTNFDLSSLTNWVNDCVFTNHFDIGSLTNLLGSGFGTNTFDFSSLTNLVDIGSLTNLIDLGAITNCLPGSLSNIIDFVEAGRGELGLPDGVGPADIASISITDSNGVVDLTGDLTSVTNILNGVFTANVAITAGPACPDTQGHAVMNILINKGKQRGKFLLVAQHSCPGQKLKLVVDGVNVGTVRSDKRGKVTIKKLPVPNLADVSSVVVEDAEDDVVLSVDF